MSIHQLVKLATTALLATMLVCAVTFYFGVDAIRIGGPRHEQLQSASDLQADILPPPLYLVEANLEAVQLVGQPSTRDRRITKLGSLEHDFHDRAKFWASQNIPADLRAQIAGPLSGPGERFWRILHTKLIPAVNRNDPVAAEAALGQLEQAYDQHRRAVDQLVTAANSFKESMIAEAHSSLILTTAMLMLLGLALLGGTFVASRLLLRRVVMPLGDLAEVTAGLAEGRELRVPDTDRRDELGRMANAVEYFRKAAADRRAADQRDTAEKKAMIDTLAGALTRMAEGDLRSLLEADFNDDFGAIGENLNRAISALRMMVQAVVQSASSIQHGAAGIADASSDLSTHAAAIEQTTAALAGVDQRVASSRDAAQSTAESAERAKRAVEIGLAKAQAAALTMEEVKAAAASVDEVMEALDKIAFQTRVLAMNAAIEAGAAGAAGKGFAVVAGLVSQLASRAEAEAHEAREQLTATASRIADAVGSVSEVEREFSGIVAEVAAVTGLVSQLSQDARAQAGAVAEISAAMRQMDISTQQNAAMVEQTSAAAEALLGEAKGLVEQAETFKWNRRERSLPVAVERRGGGGARATVQRVQTLLAAE